MVQANDGVTRACEGGHVRYDFEASQLLYRLAFATAVRRAVRANQAAALDGDPERAARAFDAAVESVVLFQASAEAWINYMFESHGLHTHGGGWIARWNGIGKVAAADGRPLRSVKSEHRDLLEDVNAIRNYMLHGDAQSREAFGKRFGGAAIHVVLGGAFVDEAHQKAESLWAEARSITGHQTPTSSGAWVAADEMH